MSPLQTLLLLCCADPYTPITPTSSHADVTHHTRGHTLRHTSSYTVYLAQPHSLQSFNYRSGSSVNICTRTSQATHQQSHEGHAVTLAPYEAPHSQHMHSQVMRKSGGHNTTINSFKQLWTGGSLRTLSKYSVASLQWTILCAYPSFNSFSLYAVT